MTLLARFSLDAVAGLIFASLAAFPAASYAVETVPSHAATSNQSFPQTSGEDWKGNPSPGVASFSVMTGVGIVDDYHAGWALIGAVSKKVLDHGFIPEINNSVSVEGEFGPILVAGSPAWFYSAHARWDFIMNPSWTFYTLFGLAGNVQGDALGNHFIFLPRIGAGALYSVTESVLVRAEISHELIVLGATFPF